MVGNSRRTRRISILPINGVATNKKTSPVKCAKTDSTCQTRERSFCSIDDECPVTGYRSDITEDYHILPQVIGSGHYGSVRECVSRIDRQWYAVKSIDKRKIGRLDHLKREVYLLSKMNHKNIINMVDCYEDEDFVHIVTDKYTGGELFDKIIENTSSDGCFSEVRSAQIIKSVLEAVAYLHANEIVHRDIKPENILFESDEEDSPVKLIDFGLSRRHQRGEALMSNPVGTAYYMSPELLKGKYDRSCDVWSIGVVAYILICGYPPFNGDTDPEIFEAIKKGSYSFPSKGWTGVSDECKDFVKCLLRKDPRKRFTAEEALMHPWVRHSCIFSKKEELLARISKLTVGMKNVRVHC
jgi:serine/threonine protein kinase